MSKTTKVDVEHLKQLLVAAPDETWLVKVMGSDSLGWSHSLCGWDTDSIEWRKENVHLAAAMRNNFPALLSELKRLREIVAKLPTTADGVPIVPGMTVYFEAYDSECFGVPHGTIVHERVQSIHAGKSFSDYKGDFTIGGSGRAEFGNLECYACPEAVYDASPSVRNRYPNRETAAAAKGGKQ